MRLRILQPHNLRSNHLVILLSNNDSSFNSTPSRFSLFIETPDIQFTMEISAQPADSSPSQLNGADGELYQQLHSYPFTSDPEFKLGLAVILRQPGTPASDERINRTDDLVLKAKCFYFSRSVFAQRVLKADTQRADS